MFDRLKKKLHRRKQSKAEKAPEVPVAPKPAPAPVPAPSSTSKNADEPPSTSAPRGDATGVPDESTPASSGLPDEKPQAEPEPVNRDLWRDALAQLPPFKQETLKKMGLDEMKSASAESTIQDLVSVVNEKQAECEKKFWKVSVGGEDIVLRNYTTQIVGWLEKAGDVAIQFAPPQASLPWSVLKKVMQIPVIEGEQMAALLGTTEKIVRVISRGQVYEQVYLPSDPSVTLDTLQKNLESGLLKIYSISLELLADSGTLFSRNTARRTLDAIVNPGKVSGGLAGIAEQEDDLLRDVQACEVRRSANADNSMIGMLETFNDPIFRIDEGVSRILEQMEEKDRIPLLEWISSIPFGKNHDNVKEKRAPGTGEWLLQHEDFRNWEEQKSSVLFWLQGSPGTGKTYLTSSVIDHIQGVLEAEPPKDEGFAIFYCDRNEARRAQPLSVLQSFVRQLSTTAKDPELIQAQLRAACTTAREKGTTFRFEQCKELLQATMDSYDKTTLVIDAMDECDPASRDELIDVLNSFLIESKKPVKIFISSRPDPDIKMQLESSPNVGISASDNQEDIKKYLDIELDKMAKKASFLKGAVKTSVIDKLLERCQGMFQWASLQVHQIMKCQTKSSVMKRLDSLPDDLQSAYDEVWAEIEAFEEPDQTLAKRALLWTIVACKPLSTTEILSAIRIDSNGDMMSLDDKVDEQGLLSLCKNFLTIDTQLNVWRFSHLSVIEYLETKQDWSLPKMHYHVASASLSYFINSYGIDAPAEIDAETSDADSETSDREKEPGETDDGYAQDHLFNIYMRHSWIIHLREAQDNEEKALFNLVKRFLGSPDESSLQYQSWFGQITRDIGVMDYSPFYNTGHFDASPEDFFEEFASETLAIFGMCRLPLQDILGEWLESAELDLSLINKRGHNLLAIAARAGSLPICKLLVAKGVDVNRPLDGHCYGSALVAAAAGGYLDVVKYLVEAGADVNMLLAGGASNNNNALSAAVSAEKTDIVRYLVKEAKADVTMPLPRSDKGCALGEAAYTQGYEIVKILLEAGCDVNMTFPNDKNTLLLAKISRGELESVKYLVKNAGATVNLLPEGGTVYPAEAAVDSSSLEILKFLIQKGVDVNALSAGGPNGSALAAACVRNGDNLPYLRCLIDAGANPNAQLPAGSYGSALAAAAARWVDEDVWEYLCKEAGADINLKLEHGPYGTALIAAQTASSGDYDTVAWLIEFGADPKVTVEGKNSPLAAAVVGGQWYRVDELLRAGADVNVSVLDPDLGSPLAYSSVHMFEEGIMETLVEAGADVNRTDPAARYGTALIASALWCNVGAVKFLIQSGADVNLKMETGPYTTALEAAQASLPLSTEEDKAFLLRICGGDEVAADMIEDDREENQEEVIELLKENGATA